MVGIKDVALMAGVSDRTVSRVVHEDKSVSKKTREKVKEAINQLGYVPNRGALLMRTKRSGIIGVMTDFVSTTPFSTDIIRGIQSAVEERGYSLLTVNTGGDLERTRKSWKELKGHRIDGVIFVTMYQRVLAPDELDPEVKTVLVNCHPGTGSDLCAILPEEVSGMNTAVDMAVAAGHRKIGYFRLNPAVMASEIRERALRQALSQYGISLRDEWCLNGAEGPVFFDKYIAFEQARILLKSEGRPTLLFCGNDEIALQVFSAAASLGLRVPQDLSLIGFDNFTVVTEVMRPTLTTVALPYFEMGQDAVSAISQEINGNPQSGKHFVDCRFVKRDSLIAPNF